MSPSRAPARTFQELVVWQKAHQFVLKIYEWTSNFPKSELYGLTSQLRRAAVSISSNLAEGCSRSSKNDFARFVEIATGSALEVASQAVIARNLGYLSEPDFQQIQTSALEITRMLSGLRQSLLRDSG